MFRRDSRIFAIIVLLLGFLCISLGMKAQRVVLNDTQFIEQSDSTVSRGAQLTIYTYRDKHGDVYPVYLSSNGNAFIIKKSKRTGREYRKYLPKVTEQLKD